MFVKRKEEIISERLSSVVLQMSATRQQEFITQNP